MTARKPPVGGKARSCAGKKAHDSKARAEAHIRLVVRGGAHLWAYEVYECGHCGAWHVGHRSRRDRRGR